MGDLFERRSAPHGSGQGSAIYFFIRDKSANIKNFNHGRRRVHGAKKQKIVFSVSSVIADQRFVVVQFFSTVCIFCGIHRGKKVNDAALGFRAMRLVEVNISR
jgi:hypothetical protein